MTRRSQSVISSVYIVKRSIMQVMGRREEKGKVKWRAYHWLRQTRALFWELDESISVLLTVSILLWSMPVNWKRMSWAKASDWRAKQVSFHALKGSKTLVWNGCRYHHKERNGDDGSAGNCGTYQLNPVHRGEMCQFNNKGEQSHGNVVISTDMWCMLPRAL